MIILGIETSCDETAAAVLEQKNGRIQILSNIVASSASIQSKYGGIIPEQAAREQIKSIIPVIQESLQAASSRPQDIDAIAITQGPGLMGSLLVGVETVKVLAKIWDKPLIPVNHLIGHFYANWIARGDSEEGSRREAAGNEMTEDARRDTELAGPRAIIPSFPCIGLLVSGGHSDLVLFKDHGKYEYLGGTRDDAAGECFDKCARLLGLPYPGGPEISKLAKDGKDTFNLPRPLFESKDFDFSFSGLKTAVHNLLPSVPKSEYPDLAASIEASIIDCLVEKTIRAIKTYGVEQIIVAGGVAANKALGDRLQATVEKEGIKLFIPPPYLCTDNGAMIAAAAFFQKPIKDKTKLQANPNLSLAY
jgi:N6-L-threonylcarbamoyladenine synthase